jgi:hypothetical protein
MMRFPHLGFTCVLLLAVFLARMVTTAQGESELTLDVLRSGARFLVVGGVTEFAPFNFVGLTVSSPVGSRDHPCGSEYTQRLSLDQEGCDDLVI